MTSQGMRYDQVGYWSEVKLDIIKEYAEEKASNEAITEAFRKRLKEVARFKHVPHPIAMRNSQNGDAFMRDTLAPLIIPSMATYQKLKADILEKLK